MLSRSPLDRLRHTLLFELFGLILASPLTYLLSEGSLFDAGVLTLVLSLIAMSWNYLFNLAFDHLLIYRSGHCQKNQRTRALHAIVFELTLIAMSLPLIAWWLDTSLLHAAMVDLTLMLFYMLYTYLYNLAYDYCFPLTPRP